MFTSKDHVKMKKYQETTKKFKFQFFITICYIKSK